jgi:prepilin-type processing-associated H-X9-DG protein
MRANPVPKQGPTIKELAAMHRKTDSHRWRLAFSLTEIMAVSAIVTSIPTAQYVRAKQKAEQIACVHNLQQIGKAILMHQMGEGRYPDAEFYPDAPFADEKSIAKILEDSGAGLPREIWVCPAAPPALAAKKLTFVFNDTFAGRTSLPNPEKAWLLIEVNCVSKRVPPPHPNGYNILFADGHVVTTKRLPQSITAKQQAAIQRLRKELPGG